MDRKVLIRNSLVGIAPLATASKLLEYCSKSDNDDASTNYAVHDQADTSNTKDNVFFR